MFQSYKSCRRLKASSRCIDASSDEWQIPLYSSTTHLIMTIWAIIHISRFEFIDLHTNYYVEWCFHAHKSCGRLKSSFAPNISRGVLGRGTSTPKFVCRGTSATIFWNGCDSFRNRLFSTYNKLLHIGEYFRSLPGILDMLACQVLIVSRFHIQICMGNAQERATYIIPMQQSQNLSLCTWIICTSSFQS